MTRALRFIPFGSPEDRGWAEAAEIYRHSFPRKERRSEEDFLRALGDPAFRADGIWLDERLAGILYHWHYDDRHYVEHLAVSPALRGQRIGSRALTAFCRGKRVILEIDPPETEIAMRRKRFYEHIGFVANPQEYIHPSFGAPAEAHRLVLMSYPTALENDEARRFADFIRERVLLYSQLPRPVTGPVLP